MTTQFQPSRTEARKAFDGGNRLFDACWRVYLGYLNGAIDNPIEQADVDGWLSTIAAEKVNNPRSSFYIYG